MAFQLGLLILSLVAAAGWLLLGHQVMDIFNKYRLKTSGQKCIARVLEKRYKSGSKESSPSYFIKIAFVTKEVNIYKLHRLYVQHESETNQRVYDGVAVEHLLEICYDIENPLNYCINDHSKNPFLSLCCNYFTIASLCFGLLLNIPCIFLLLEMEPNDIFIGIGLFFVYSIILWLMVIIVRTVKQNNRNPNPIKVATEHEILQLQSYKQNETKNISIFAKRNCCEIPV